MTYIKASEEVIDAATDFVKAHEDFYRRIVKWPDQADSCREFVRLCAAVLSGPSKASGANREMSGDGMAEPRREVVLPSTLPAVSCSEELKTGFEEWWRGHTERLPSRYQTADFREVSRTAYAMGFHAGRAHRGETAGRSVQETGDAVNHPFHYNSGGIEVIEAIEAWDLGFCLGNAVKYIARAGKKDPAKTLEDLKKAQWYLSRLIERLEKA